MFSIMILSLEHQKEVQILKSLYFLELGFVLVTKTAKFLPGMTKMSYLSNIKISPQIDFTVNLPTK